MIALKPALILLSAVAALVLSAAYLVGGRYEVRGGGGAVIIVDRFTGTAKRCHTRGCRELVTRPELDLSEFSQAQ